MDALGLVERLLDEVRRNKPGTPIKIFAWDNDQYEYKEVTGLIIISTPLGQCIRIQTDDL